MEPGRISTGNLDLASGLCCVLEASVFVDSHSCPVRRERCNSWWLELQRRVVFAPPFDLQHHPMLPLMTCISVLLCSTCMYGKMH
jgi:hypothetical protein